MAAADSTFCIIESRDAVRDFDNMQLKDIQDNIATRRNRIFLLMEEVRRLRIQQRLRGGDVPRDQEVAEETFSSALPFLPPLTAKNLNAYYTFYGTFVMGLIVFGGLLAPILEVKLGIGGTSYAEFVASLNLPSQLAQVDPIVASFCGGAVGVVSALLVVEVNNIDKQRHNRCHYCEGTGYLMCGNCVGSGINAMSHGSCTICSGTGKVMCTSCLCTGKQMATEHDPRFDPFQ